MRRDIREAFRLMRANPGFAAVVVLTLALGIGVNSTIFSVLNGVLLRPLQYARPAELVVLWEQNTQLGQAQQDVSGATYLDWRDRSKTFASIGAYRYRGFTLTGEGSGSGAAERVASVDVSPAVFTLLGVPTTLGRTFGAEEERPGHERLSVISYGAWMRRFGGDPNVVGKSLLLDGQPHQIVGVMPKTFQFPAGDPDVEVWSPLTLDLTSLASRPHRMYKTIGRLASGASIDQARAEMGRIAADIAREHPDSNAGWTASLVPAHE
ncbi:MAG: ABC transporter permease, partial [Acidobacteriota bacterium]